MIIDEVDPQSAKKPPSNLVELAQEYKTSSWFSNLAPSTKAKYDILMVPLLASSYGLKSIDTITPRIADLIYNQVLVQHGETTAMRFQAVWHRVFEFACKYEYAMRNPWRKIKVVVPKPRTVAWTEDQVFKVIEYALANNQKPLAIAVCLLYDTGQRPGDIMYLTYGQIKKDSLGYYLEIKQSKRGAEVKPALSPYTVGLLGGPEAIASKPPEELVVDANNMRVVAHMFEKARKALGFTSIQLRDLRRTTLTEMGEASDDLMVSVSGHKDRDMLNIYSLRNRHKALEAQRIRHVSRNSRLNTEFTSISGPEAAV